MIVVSGEFKQGDFTTLGTDFIFSVLQHMVLFSTTTEEVSNLCLRRNLHLGTLGQTALGTITKMAENSRGRFTMSSFAGSA